MQWLNNQKKSMFVSTLGRAPLALALLSAAGIGCAGGEGGSTLAGLGDSEARTSLQALSGCFSVRYQFTENSTQDFLISDNIEYMDIRAQGDGYLARNFLITGPESSFLHWNQEWTPLGDGRWSVRVTDGADQLRYETDGVWRFNQWESEPAPAVKPTRDSERTDYEVLERRSSLQLTADGWIQAEINLKLAGDGTPVASELGWIVYARLPDTEACAPAIAMAEQP